VFKISFSRVTLSRLGLCLGAMVLLWIYVNIAVYIHLNFYLPIGLLLMSAYSWFVMNKFKNIYPEKIKAIGQLFVTFFLYGISSSFYSKQMMESIKLGKEGIESKIFTLATYNALATIAGVMSLGLMIMYIVLKIKSKKQMQR